MFKKLVVAGLLAFSIPTAAFASGNVSAGPRLGFSVSPDQVLLGGQVEIAEVAPKISFVPNLELGFGDKLNIIGLGFDFHYHLKLRDSDWVPYLGAGIAINFVEFDNPAPFDNSETQAGGSLIFGTEVPTRSNNRFFAETKLGLADTASLKLLAGWNFRF